MDDRGPSQAEWEQWNREAYGEEPYTNGHGGGYEPAPPPLPLIDIRQWHGVEPRPRQWIVHERIPDRNVTLLSGNGGIGKTLLMQQLSIATVLGTDWLGTMPEPGPVLFVTAEDDEDEMHFRYDRIAKHYNTNFNDLADAGLRLVSLAGKDAAMAIANNRGVVQPTSLYDSLKQAVDELHPRWIALDTAADVFVINERDRTQVRQCISLLRGIALDFNTAVILLSHPSLTGMSTGTGLSGSTAWNNSVRSRLYLEAEKPKKGKGKKKDDEEDDEVDPNSARILKFMKSNYSALAMPVRLTWQNGLLLPAKGGEEELGVHNLAAREQKARDLFLVLLKRNNEQDRPVSEKKTARNYAPAEFAELPETLDLHADPDRRKGLLKLAMDWLFNNNKIHIDWGPKIRPPSQRNECLMCGPKNGTQP